MLTREQFVQLEELFDAVLAAPEAQWPEVSEQLCEHCPELREPLAALLSAHAKSARNLTNRLVQDVGSQLQAHIPELVHAGAQIGEYRLLEQIGVGGMGRVYRASRTFDGVTREFALKLLRQELANSTLLARFQQEKAILQRMEHPGICRLLDAGALANGTPYVVMELIQGKNLLEYCQQHQLTLPQRISLFRKVLSAVGYAHQHLIVHRDLKAMNILVDHHGEPKLLDFGIAKALDQAGAQTQTATVDRFLSFAHAAPEQLRGQMISTSCDIYALGALLYQLLSGASPFDYERLSAGELERHIVSIPPDAMTKRATEVVFPAAPVSPWRERGFAELRALQRGLRGDLESIVQRCLRKNPDERYRSVEQLDEDLERFLHQRPIRAKSSNAWYRMRKFVARNRLACGLSAVLALSIIVGATAVVLRTREVAAQAQRAQQALDILRSAFLSADPARVAGQEVSAHAVLEAAVPQLEQRFDDAPELYANLAGTIAEVNLSLGFSPQSALLFERAILAAQKAKLPAQTQFELRTWAARASYASGAFDAADTHLAQAEQLGVALTPEWQVSRAITLTRRGKRVQAIKLFELAVVSMANRARHDEWANSARLRLADVLRQNGENDRAMRVLGQTLSWQASALEPDHPRVLLTKIQVASQKDQLGHRDEALRELQIVLQQVKKNYGERSPFVAKAAMVLGNIHARADENATAAKYYREAMAIFHTELGDAHPNAIRNVFNLAQVLHAQPNQRDEAAIYYLQSLTSAEQSFGLQSNATATFRNAYAQNLLARERFDEALALLTSDAAETGVQSSDALTVSSYLALLQQAQQHQCAGTATRNASLCVATSKIMNKFVK